jgi:hypothetical protein
MTRNKAHLVNQLCKLKNMDPGSEAAKEFYSLKVLDLMICIQKERAQQKKEEEEDEDDLVIKRFGANKYV